MKQPDPKSARSKRGANNPQSDSRPNRRAAKRLEARKNGYKSYATDIGYTEPGKQHKW